MTIAARMHYIIIGIFAVVALSACGKGNSKSALAGVSVVPDKPIVITADVKIDDKTITSPWFQFVMRMTNGAPEPITIVALTLQIFSVGSSGTPDMKEVAFAPGEFDFSLNSDVECKYTTFGTWDPNDTKALTLRNGNTACDRTPVFIVGGNTKPIGANYRYRVVAQPQGWFGTATGATDRFEKKITFYTQ